MEESIENHRAELEAFVEGFGRQALAYAFCLTRNWQDAEDLVQDSFRRLTGFWARVSQVREVRFLFLVILRNAFVDLVKRKKGRLMSIDVEHEGVLSYHERLPHPEADVLDQLIRRETASQVHECLDRLRPSYRRILTSADLEGKSYERIASELRLPIGTVKSRLSRARESFRKNANGLRPLNGTRSMEKR